MQTARKRALAYETTVQVPITIAVCPFDTVFERRKAQIEELQRQFVAHASKDVPGKQFSSKFVWMDGVTTESYVVRRSDPVFEDVFERGPKDSFEPGCAPLVFGDWGGRVARLPDGYVVAWSTAPNADKSNAHPMSRRIMKMGSTVRLTDMQVRDVLRRSYAHANRGVRFVGIALSPYNALTDTPDNTGIAALQSGRCTLPNNSGEILLKGTLVCWEFPGMGDTIYMFGSLGNARPRLKKYKPPQVTAGSFKEGFRRLLFKARPVLVAADTTEMHDLPSFHLARRSAATPPTNPSAPRVVPEDETKMLDSVMGSDIGQLVGLQFIHCVEEIFRAVTSLAVRTDFTKNDATFGGLPSFVTDDGVKYNMLRSVLAEAMQTVPDASMARDEMDRMPAELRTDALLAPTRDAMRAFFSTLAKISPGFPTSTADGVEQPFARVVVGAVPDMPVDVKLL